MEIVKQNKKIRVGGDAIMMHNYRTEKGDSGTPFITQPEQSFFCHIVGIHVAVHIDSKRESTKKGVTMTLAVIERMKDLMKGTFGKEYDEQLIDYIVVDSTKVKKRMENNDF